MSGLKLQEAQLQCRKTDFWFSNVNYDTLRFQNFFTTKPYTTSAILILLAANQDLVLF